MGPIAGPEGTSPSDQAARVAATDQEVINRLRRIEGQIVGIRKMYEEGRYCIDVLDQVAAARAGLEATGLIVLEDHVHGCVREAIEGGSGAQKAAELLEAVRRFVRSV